MDHTLSFSCTLRDLLASLLIYINLAMFTLEFSRIVAVSATSGFRNRMVYYHFLINRIYGFLHFWANPLFPTGTVIQPGIHPHSPCWAVVAVMQLSSLLPITGLVDEHHF